MKILEKFKEYIKNIKKEDKIAVLYHAHCADGLSSCIILNKSLERILKRKIDYNIHYTYFEITDDIIKFFKKNKINKVIFVDLSIYINENMIREAEKYVDLLIIDHHEYINDINNEKTTFIHSTFINNNIKSSAYPASKLVYDIFSDLTDITDLDWLASLGLISDMGYEQWKDFVNKTIKKYKAKQNDKIFLSDFGISSVNISTSKRFSDNIEDVFQIVYNAKSYNDIMENKTLLKYKKMANDEIKYWIDNSNKSEKYKNMIIYEIKPKYAIGSTLSTILSREYFKENTIIIICDLEDGSLKLNARDQNNKIRMNDLLQKAIENIPNSNAGGHAPASGGKIPKEYLELFKKQLKESYNNLIK